MKKIFLLTMLMVASLGMKAETTDAISAKVSGTELDIALTNSVEYVAFQMDITLPSTVDASAFTAVSDRLTQDGADNTIGSGKFLVASNLISTDADAGTHTYRVIAYNLANASIAGTSGDDILAVTLSATVSPSSDVSVSNIIFVTASDLAEVTLNNVTGVDGYKMGDVNGDGKVNSSDLAMVIDSALAGDTSSSTTLTVFKAGDFDSNDKINSVDLAAEIDAVLSAE